MREAGVEDINVGATHTEMVLVAVTLDGITPHSTESKLRRTKLYGSPSWTS